MQLPFVLLGVMLNIPTSANIEYFHKTLEFNGQQFYVYTADPRAFGKAYHYVYLTCPRPWGRYELRT